MVNVIELSSCEPVEACDMAGPLFFDDYSVAYCWSWSGTVSREAPLPCVPVLFVTQ